MSPEIDGPSYDVFISHASEDKHLANAVCATLEQQQLRCWIAPRDIVAGATWGKVIIEAIDHCRVIVVIVSTSSNHSPYVLREVERAIHRGLPVLPVRIEDVPLSKELELFLSSTHWLDAITPPVEEHFGRLAASIKALIAGGSGPVPPPPQERRRRKRVFALAGAGLLAVAGLAAWKLWPPPAPGVYKDVNALVQAAERGETEAQWQLAKRYLKGDGVAKDLEQAARWCRKAAEQGHFEAADRLGALYYFGDGVPQDAREAVKWFAKAAEGGLAAGQLHLGNAHAYGEGGLPVNFAKAAENYRKAAEQGNVFATGRLGNLYERGDGVNKDLAEAAKWYLKAAEQDDIPAQLALGEFYRDGKGVPANIIESQKWFKRAADQGDPMAQNAIGDHLEFGDPKKPYGVTPDYQEAARWYQRASDQGYPLAQFNLGRCFEAGNGVQRNDVAAAVWYGLAMRGGHSIAREALSRVDYRLTDDERYRVKQMMDTWEEADRARREQSR